MSNPWDKFKIMSPQWIAERVKHAKELAKAKREDDSKRDEQLERFYRSVERVQKTAGSNQPGAV